MALHGYCAKYASWDMHNHPIDRGDDRIVQKAVAQSMPPWLKPQIRKWHTNSIGSYRQSVRVPALCKRLWH